MKWILLAALLTLSACSDFQLEQDIQLLCPAPPVAWQIAFPGLAFRVATRDARGGTQEAEIADWRVPACVRCARGVNSPIVAWPYEPGNAKSPVSVPGVLRPAGGFFPLSFRARGNREVVQLSWEDGAAALVVSRVAAAGCDITCLNVARLSRFLRESGEPWALDLDDIAQGIAQGEFTAWDIDMLPCRDVELEPGPGIWFLESPFSPSFEAMNGRIFFPRIALGPHRLFSLAGSSWRIEIGENEYVLKKTASAVPTPR